MDNKLIKIIFSIALLSSTSLSNAAYEDNDNKLETIDCSYSKGYIEGLPTNLTNLQQQAVKVGQEICFWSLKVLPSESIELTDRIINFATAAREEFGQIFPEDKFDGVSKLSKTWYDRATRPTNDYKNFAIIEGVRHLSGMPPSITGLELKLYADLSSKKEYTLTQAQKDHCSEIIDNSSISPPDGVKDCKNALDIWGNAISPFQYLYTNRVLEKNGQKIVNLQDKWKTFIKNSRYQTPLDVWATTAWYSDQFKRHHLSGPPPAQLFLFHPTIVYEHLYDAEKGSKEDVSVAIEWAGVNWWLPGFGFSVTSVYKDRKDQPSVGTGATFHIKNKYSIGYIYRDDGDDSLFFNIDLLEWLGDKEEKYKKYKTHFQ